MSYRQRVVSASIARGMIEDAVNIMRQLFYDSVLRNESRSALSWRECVEFPKRLIPAISDCAASIFQEVVQERVSIGGGEAKDRMAQSACPDADV